MNYKFIFFDILLLLLAVFAQTQDQQHLAAKWETTSNTSISFTNENYFYTFNFPEVEKAGSPYELKKYSGFAFNDNVSKTPAKSIENKYLQVFPSSFSDELHIALRIPDNQTIKLEIFDSNGRLVKTLADNPFNDSLGHLIWTGTNNQELECPDGVYLAKLTYSGKTFIEKVVKKKFH